MICSNRGTGILPVSFSASNRQERLFLFRHQTGRMPVPQISIQFGTATSLVLTVEQAGKTVSFSASNRQDGCFFFGIKQAGCLFHKYLSNLGLTNIYQI
jgi:hypothetical protein